MLVGAHRLSPLEGLAAAAFAEGNRDLATTLVIEGYGPEICSYLSLCHRSEDDCAEVFSLFSEAVWRSSSTFEGRSSVRTWAYAVARLVSLRYRRDQRRRQKRFRPFGDHPALAELEARVRTETLTFLRTEMRTKLAQLRDALPAADRELLTLRIDRRLSWSELALVFSDPDVPLGEGDLKREAARLRKRFQILKERLRQAARREGLLGGGEEPDAE